MNGQFKLFTKANCVSDQTCTYCADAQYWHAQKTFEERCTDDWDVDTSVYYGESSAGDRDARDMKSMLPGHGQDSEPSVFVKYALPYFFNIYRGETTFEINRRCSKAIP